MYIKCFVLFLFFLSLSEARLQYGTSSRTCLTPRILNGKARLRARGSVVRFSCFNSYTLVGNRYSTCRNGRWDVPVPVCIKSGCSEIPEVMNAVNMTSHNNAWVIFFCMPRFELQGSPVLYCDGSHWNSTAPQCIDTTAEVQYACDFEKPDICGWKADELHDFDWRRWNRETPSSFLQTGPKYDHTYGKFGKGFYMYIESSGQFTNTTARLISPVYNAQMSVNACFIFYYHMYGRSMGGLRIYQKPEKLSMAAMLNNTRNYTVFEIWGNQGDEWIQNVTMLKDYSDDFQLVIEGIRGHNVMSDLAIDDVSLQHGQTCTDAYNAAYKVPPEIIESCVGRCDVSSLEETSLSCGCSILCAYEANCCPDYFDVCISSLDSGFRSDDNTSSTTEIMPQTQKLILTTTETPTTVTLTTTSTTPSSTSPSTTSTTTSTTSTTTSTTTTTTTRRPTTIRTRPPTTTRRPTTIRTRPKTTSTSTTTLKPTTVIRTTPKRIITTPKRTITPKVITTTVTTSTKLTTSPTISTPAFVKSTKGEDVIVDRKIDSKKLGALKADRDASKKSGMSRTSIAVTVILVCGSIFGLIWLAVYMAQSRGILALARLRARADNNTEVRYLASDVDDE